MIYYENENIAELSFDGNLTENKQATLPYGGNEYFTLAGEAWLSIKDLTFIVTPLGPNTYKVSVNGVDYYASFVAKHGIVIDNTPPDWRGLEANSLIEAMAAHPVENYPIPFLSRPFNWPAQNVIEKNDNYVT